MTTPWWGSGGWSLRAVKRYPEAPSTLDARPVLRYFLDDVPVTLEQSRALAAARPGCSLRLDDAGQLIIASGIELTRAEQDAVITGADPLNLLLSPLIVRPLRERELREGAG